MNELEKGKVDDDDRRTTKKPKRFEEVDIFVPDAADATKKSVCNTV